MNSYLLLDPKQLLELVASTVPNSQRDKIVVIGSIATAWAFRDVMEAAAVQTKDIDIVLHPAASAPVTAVLLGEDWLEHGWMPQFPNGQRPANADTPEDKLPALRLRPPEDKGDWFVELLGEPLPDQRERRRWRRFDTSGGSFGLPSFRFMGVAIHDPKDTDFGIRVAQPACMALAHLLEHAEPDKTLISGMDNTPRYFKDVGRAVALWWLAGEQAAARPGWRDAWLGALSALYSGKEQPINTMALDGLETIRDFQVETAAVAARSVLAPFNLPLRSWQRAYEGLHGFITRLM